MIRFHSTFSLLFCEIILISDRFMFWALFVFGTSGSGDVESQGRESLLRRQGYKIINDSEVISESRVNIQRTKSNKPRNHYNS